MEKIFIIIPVYNEAAVITSVIESLRSTRWQLILIDDGSQDETWKLINRSGVFRLRHKMNLGQGAALFTGIRYALIQEADFIVSFDADGQHLAADIPALLEPVLKGEADIALGSRFLEGAETNASPGRRITLKLAGFFNWLLTGIRLTDAHNGLRAMNAKAASMIQLRESRMAHASEFLQEIRRHKLRYIEVPVHIKYTDYSIAKGQKLSGSFAILWDLFKRKIFNT